MAADEAAAAIRTTPEHVRALLRAGTLVGFRLDDGPRARHRVPAELERFIAGRRTTKEDS